MNKLNLVNKLVGSHFRSSNSYLLPSSKLSFYKPLCSYQFSKYKFGSKQIASDRKQPFNEVYQEQIQNSASKFGYLALGAGLLLGGYYGLQWIQQRNLEISKQEAVQEERVAVENAIDKDDYQTEIALLEQSVMENKNFSLEYAFILHFSYVKLQMFDKAAALEQRMLQYYPKQTLVIHRYMACHYLSMENYVIALKHLIYAAKNYPKVSQEDKKRVETEIESYVNDLSDSEQYTDLVKADLLSFLGQIYSYLSLYKESEYFFRQSLQIKPSELINSYQLAVVLLHQQFFDESEQILQNLIKSPQIDNNLKTLATEELSIIYLCENNEQKAMDVCQKLNPDSEKQCRDIIERTKAKQKKRFGNM